MGEEIDKPHFKARDFREFEQRLKTETETLRGWFAQNRFSPNEAHAGLELEIWLVDEGFAPAPVNEELLEALADPLVSPELAKFNIELNSVPQPLIPGTLSKTASVIQDALDRLERIGRDFGATPLMIGILPTATLADFCLANMSGRNRYRALNEQMLRSREGQPLKIDIEGPQRLRIEHRNVMLEAAATSFQIHLAPPPDRLSALFNAALAASAPMVAASANSPMFLGQELWEETRIALFEQSVEVGGELHNPHRVTFGSGFLKHSALELFEENVERFKVLLPMSLDQAAEPLPHLRLHNGTIWRWNRILIGFDERRRPQLRIEHRPTPAGPSVIDMIADAALYFGLIHGLVEERGDCGRAIGFDQVRDNFYRAARFGLAASVGWFDGERLPLRRLLLDRLIPLAHRGLASLGIEAAERGFWLDIVAARVDSGLTGSAWQRSYYRNHGRDPVALTRAYLERQRTREPVHRWSA